MKAQLKSIFDLSTDDVLLVSAETDLGLEHVFPAVIERICPPTGTSDSPLWMLLFHSFLSHNKSVICYVSVIDGMLSKGDKVSLAASGQSYEVLDVGIMEPELTSK